MKKIYFIAIILILFGIGSICYPIISNYFAEKNQIKIIKEYNENINSAKKEQLEQEYEKACEYNEQLAKKIEQNKQVFEYELDNILNIFENGMMGYIEIPKININLPIYHGTKEETLKKYVGHLEQSSVPVGGKTTHCILTGHTGLKNASIFTRLNELEIGDYFYIKVLNMKLIYKIYQKKTVLPNDVEDLQIVPDRDLVTLVTCTPYGINSHRLLVQGEREITEQSEQIAEEKNIQENELSEEKYLYKKIYVFLIILFIISLGCILLKYIVKYKKKK